MNVWPKTYREPSRAHRKGSWLGALARSLRNWWDRFLLGDARPAAGQSQEEAPPSPPLSVAEHESTSALVKPQEPIDPVEDWLVRVREGAPELLLSPEEGGTPWVRAAEAGGETPETIEDVEDAGDWLQELTPELTNPRSQERERTRPEVNEATRDKRTKGTWLNFFKRKAEAKKGTADSASVEIPRGSAGEESSSQAATLDFQPPRRANSRNLTESRRPNFSKTHKGEVPLRDGMRSSRRNVDKLSGTGVMLPLFKGRTRDETSDREPKEADLYSAAPANSFKETTSWDRASSNLAVSHPTLPGTAGEVNRPATRFGAKRSEAGPAPAQTKGKTARRISPNVIWPTIPRRESSQRTLDKRLFFTDELSGGKQSRGSDELSKSESDRWPDLPDDLGAGDLDWIESLRDREHLHALEIEQQGGN